MSLQHNLAWNCPHLWGQHRKMHATHQSKHMQKSTCRVYSALTVLWQASWTPPVQKPQPGGTWHSSTLKGSRYTSSHGRCKPDPAGKIVISLPWQCFFRLYSDVLPWLQLNCVKGSCSQPHGWLSHGQGPRSPRCGMALPFSNLPREGHGFAHPTWSVTVVQETLLPAGC